MILSSLLALSLLSSKKEESAKVAYDLLLSSLRWSAEVILAMAMKPWLLDRAIAFPTTLSSAAKRFCCFLFPIQNNFTWLDSLYIPLSLQSLILSSSYFRVRLSILLVVSSTKRTTSTNIGSKSFPRWNFVKTNRFSRTNRLLWFYYLLFFLWKTWIID